MGGAPFSPAPPTTSRIYEAIPRGTAALTSVLFFDEINRDSKGFVSADGVIIVGGFFTRYARSLYILTIPPPD